MGLFFDLSGFILGVLGCGVFQLLCSTCSNFLPKNRLKALEEAFSDVYCLFRCGVKEGLIKDESDRLEEKLKNARRDINVVRTEVVSLGNIWLQIRALFSNLPLTRRISYIDRSMKELRITIISTSEKAKLELEARGRQYNPCMLPLEATIMNGRQSLETVNPLGPGSNEHLASDCPPRTVSTDTHQTSDTHVTRSRAPSICSPPRTHRDSISSVSTSSTVVETEGFYAAPDLESGELLSGRTIPAFKTPRSVGTVIADMLLKKTYIHRPSSHVFTAEPETDSSISFQRELETLHRRFDELSSIMRQQQMGGNPVHDNTGDHDRPSIISKIPLPRAWSHSRNTSFLPV